jgi:hypothetical protein
MKVYLNFKLAALIIYYIAFSNFHLLLITTNILLKTFLSKTASRLAISLFSAQNSAPYVATGIINVLQIFIVYAELTNWLLNKAEGHNMYALLAFVILFDVITSLVSF